MAPFAYEFRGGGDQSFRGHERNGDSINRGGDRYRPRRDDADRDRSSRQQFTFRYPKPTADRPLLSRQRETTPELLVAQQEGQDQPRFKFAQLNELTDSDEAEMDESSDENEGSDSNPPRKKRAVATTESDTIVAAERPKWSNPDPYTALPPPDETQTKRPDFVKLIRKARVSSTAAEPLFGGDAVTTNEDFISFGAEDASADEKDPILENAPSGPKSSSLTRTRMEDLTAGKKRTRDDQVKVFSSKSGKVSFNTEGDIISIWKAGPSDNGSPWLEFMEPTMHIGTRCD